MVEGTQLLSEGIRPGKISSRLLSFQAQRTTFLLAQELESLRGPDQLG